MLLATVFSLAMLLLTGCGVRDAVPDDADHPLLWFVGLSAAVFLLSGSLWLVQGVIRRHQRREDRREDRGD